MTAVRTTYKVSNRALWALLGGLFVLGAVNVNGASTEDLRLMVNIADRIAPEPVADLAAQATITPGQAVLTWTAPEENARSFTTLGPVSSYQVKIGTWSIAAEIALGGSTTTWWNKAVTPSDPAPQIPRYPGEETMTVDLTPATSYWFALRSVDDAGNVSSIDSLALTPDQQAMVFTRSATDAIPPAPVAGFEVTSTGSGYTIAWSDVIENDDGSAISDLAGYRVYSSLSLFDFSASSVAVATLPVGGPTQLDIGIPSQDTYYLIVGFDRSGNMSSVQRSNYLNVSSQRFVGQMGIAHDGTQTRAYVPENLIPDLNPSGKNYLVYVDPTSSEQALAGGNKTRATYTVSLKEPDGSQAPAGATLSQPRMTVTLDYQGGHGALDKDKTGVLWWNGSAWIKVGQANVSEGTLPAQISVSFNTGVPGIYQIRQYEVAKELTLDKASVFPQIFSPNGDGLNDQIYFMIENPRESQITGRILDMSGAEVGTLRLAGNGAPTEDTLSWDGRDHSGHLVPPGVYIYKITGEGKTITGTMVVAR